MVTPKAGDPNFIPAVWGGQASQGASEGAYQEDGTAFPSPSNCTGGQPTGCSGDLVTADSAFTGEVKHIIVFANNQMVTLDDGVTRRGLAEACSDVVINPGGSGFQCADDGPVIGQEGDSGGPWIVHEANSSVNVQIAGITSGVDLATFHGHVAYYEQIGTIDMAKGVQVPLATR
jgi:hypothetical protein